MKRAFIAALAFMAVCSCSEREPYREDTEHPDATIYITNTACRWGERDTVAINGAVCPVEVLDSVTARISVPYSPQYSIIYPHTERFDNGIYKVTVPQVQSPVGQKAVSICCDCTEGRTDGPMPFITAVLRDATPRISIDVYAVGGIRAVRAELSCSGTAMSGDMCVDPSGITASTAAGGASAPDAMLSLDSMISTDRLSPTRLSFAVLPGEYRELEVRILSSDGGIHSIKVPVCIVAEGGKTAHAGTFEIHSASLVSLEITPDPNVKGTYPWTVGTAVNVNGTVCYAIGAKDNTLTVPVDSAASYTVAWPATATISDGKVHFPPAAVTGLMPKAPDTMPRLCGLGKGPVTLKQVDGILRLKIYTDPGIRRMIKSIRVEGGSLGAGFSYSPADGRYGDMEGGGAVDIDPGEPFLEGVSLTDDYTSFCICTPPGIYSGLKLYVTAYDASFKCPYELTVDDLLLTTGYDVTASVVSASAVSQVVIAPKVEYFDWIRSNGTPFIGTLPYDQSLQGIINTGWIMPASRNVSVDYEATVSGSVFDIKAERCLFGAQGNNLNRPVVLIYNKSSQTGWYVTMACMTGTDTHSKAEKNGKVFHIGRDLADRRTIQIGTEGVFGQSYFHFRYKNLDRGDSSWTELWEESSFFKFTDGNLKCNYPVVLFANNKQGNITGAISDIRFHNFKITCNGKVERDMYPCTVDGIPGMQDKVSGKFYFNDAPSVLVVTKYGCYSPMEVGN